METQEKYQTDETPERLISEDEVIRMIDESDLHEETKRKLVLLVEATDRSLPLWDQVQRHAFDLQVSERSLWGIIREGYLADVFPVDDYPDGAKVWPKIWRLSHPGLADVLPEHALPEPGTRERLIAEFNSLPTQTQLSIKEEIEQIAKPHLRYLWEYTFYLLDCLPEAYRGRVEHRIKLEVELEGAYRMMDRIISPYVLPSDLNQKRRHRRSAPDERNESATVDPDALVPVESAPGNRAGFQAPTQ